ncbi:MAG: hypothetical protein R2882_01855 [Gemmatimonadales bacterium]
MKHLVAAALVLLAGSACGTEPDPEAGHTPASAKLFNASGTEMTPALTLAAGATVRLEVRFYADDGDQITGLEAEHSAGLTFAPEALASAAPVAGQKFFFDVTAQAGAGTGTVSIGYGHGTDTDEESFGPFTVTVQ